MIRRQLNLTPPDYILNMYTRLPGGVLISKATGSWSILYANDGLLHLFECESLEDLQNLSGGDFLGLVYEPDRDSARWYFRERYHRFQKKDGEDDGVHRAVQTQYRIRTKTGRIVPVMDIANYEHDEEQGDLVYSILTRAGEEIGTEERDFLTGLPNMRSFLNTTQRAIEKGKGDHLSYIYINLAHFKRFNRRHGLDAGDLYLRKVAEILLSSFPGACVARFDADHFVVCTGAENPEEEIKKAHDRIANVREEATVELKAGIYKTKDAGKEIPVNAACDLAKIACDSIRGDPSRYIQVYDEELEKGVEQREYITENIDRAIANGWIQVYYQPVVRSIPETLCGFEALTRWIDPTYGFMNPGVFIPVLEENRLIHKLDTYVLDQVCLQIRREMEENRHPVPVSFNLSRLDFVLCDVFETIEKTVRKYDVPRDLVRIEITESTVMKDQTHMAQEIDRFRSAGYEVWMDDFGSGYSSLNMLKDFHFDELKLDMGFLRSFTGKSREILASTVRMAKKLGMHTLAEGVETKEQVDFLRSIGCEMMQGYYFGRPAPFADSMKHCLETDGLSPETRELNACYDTLGMVNLQTEKPLLLIDLPDDDVPHLLYSNPPCDELVRGIGYPTVQDFLTHLQDPSFPLSGKFRDWFAATENEDRKDDSQHTIYITDNGHYIGMKFVLVYAAAQHRAFQIYLNDVTSEEKLSSTTRMDEILQSILTSYDNILLMHLKDDYIESRFQGQYFSRVPGTRYRNIKETLKDFSAQVLYPLDRERFMRCFDPATLSDRIRASRSHSVSGQFRMRVQSGVFIWKIFICILSPDAQDPVAILTFRDSILVSDPEAEKAYNRRFDAPQKDSSTAMPAFHAAQEREQEHVPALFYSVADSLPVNLYWKDRKRRFIGASRAGQDAMGLADRSIVGRTSGEMGVHVNGSTFDEMEQQVLTGKAVMNFYSYMLIHGVPHRIRTSEVPLYDHGQITGLVGTFEDTEAGDGGSLSEGTDTFTGLANTRGVYESILAYNEQLSFDGIGYDILVLEVTSFQREIESYGSAFTKPLLWAIGQALEKSAGPGCFTGRVGGPLFVVLQQHHGARKSIPRLSKDVTEAIESVHAVEDNSVTLRVHCAALSSDDVKSPDDMMKHLVELMKDFFVEPSATQE